MQETETVPGPWAIDAPDGLQAPADVKLPAASRSRPRSRMTVGLANAMLAQLPLALAVISDEMRLLYWNEYAGALFAIPPMLAEAMPPLSELLSAAASLSQHQRDAIVAFVTEQIAAGDRADPGSCLRLSTGREARLSFQVSGLGGRRWMLMADDGTRLAQTPASAAAPGDAWLDALTGLSNRRHFNEASRVMIDAASPGTRCAILMIDLDRFKPVNDTLGHAVGDALLCLVARRLRRETREQDLLVRLGGDEFVIMLPNVATPEAFATRLVDVLSRPFLVEGNLVNISASIGIACFPEHGSSPEDLLRHADLALYDAKAAGKRTWRVFEAARASNACARRELESDLRKAMALGALSVAYQPQLNVQTQLLSGFEALLRWTHPTRGDVPPSEFIPIAEKIDCVVALGEWVLKTACTEAARWPSSVSVAVTVSPRQMENSEGLFQAVQAALQISGLPPARLDLEITENSLLSNQGQVLETLNRLRAMGVRIAMADFGTGYLSLGRLRSMPFDKINIDRSFVASLGRDSDAAAVVRAISALGAGLGMTTTVEGVEMAEQAGPVQADGCTDLRGYLFSRPISGTEVDGLISRYARQPDAAVAAT